MGSHAPVLGTLPAQPIGGLTQPVGLCFESLFRSLTRVGVVSRRRPRGCLGAWLRLGYVHAKPLFSHFYVYSAAAQHWWCCSLGLAPARQRPDFVRPAGRNRSVAAVGSAGMPSWPWWQVAQSGVRRLGVEVWVTVAGPDLSCGRLRALCRTMLTGCALLTPLGVLGLPWYGPEAG